MRIFLVLICSLGLAFTAGAAQEENKSEKPASKKRRVQSVQHAAAPAGGKQKTKASMAHHASTSYSARAGSTAGDEPQKTKEKTKGSQQGASQDGLYLGRNDGKVQQVAPSNADRLPGTPAVQLNKFSNSPFQTRHFNLPSRSKPATSAAPAVNFQQGRHIHGSQNWQGSNYQVFRSYKSEWHDKNWWSNHYNRVVFVYGGWYAWNPAGWWIPAWGYAPNSYYAWDGPVCAYNDLPPDQLIANVQAALQQRGYYEGEVDGLLGPLTREALANYQRDNGLYETAAIDQPTLQSLGMS